MKTMKWTLLLAFFALWACQEEQFSQEGTPFDASHPFPRVERLRTIKRVDNAPTTRAVGVKDKLWQPGDTIRIKFQNADEFPGMSDKVIQYAAIWLQYANLHFEYVSKEENADVKIGFNMDNRWLSWSTIGTDCKQIPQDEVSLNFVDLDLCSDEEIQGEVLRNFGHVLGLGFEHRSPTSPITLDEAKTLRYFRRDLSEEDIINDILPYYNADQTNYTKFDPQSIMVLELPQGIRTDTNSKIDLKYNHILSPNDIDFVQNSLYPILEDPDPTNNCIISIDIKNINSSFGIWLKSDVELDWGDGKREVLTVANSDRGCYWKYGPHSDGNSIQHIKIYGADTAITQFALDNCNVIALDVSKNKDLESLSVGSSLYPTLGSIDVSKNLKLKQLNCDYAGLGTLNLTNNKNLEVLDCSHNFIHGIDFTRHEKLRYVDVSDNRLTNINLSDFPNLDWFEGSNNKFRYLNFQHNTELSIVDISYNELDTIDIHSNYKLLDLEISNNRISNIDISQNPQLRSLSLDNNLVTTLNVSGHNLRSLSLSGNPIEYLTIKNTIFNSINNRPSDTPGGILIPGYCYKNSMERCKDFEHNNCDREKIRDELTTLFKTKNWNLVTSRGLPIYRNTLNKQTITKGPDYFQQLFIRKFGNPGQL